MTPAQTETPLLTFRGVPLALGLALVLCWPMLASDGYLFYADTNQYIRGGQIIWEMAAEMGSDLLGGPGGEAAAGAEGELRNARGEPHNMRSFVYSLYTLFAGAALWPAAFGVLQAAATLWLLFALVPPTALAAPRVLAGGFLLLAGLSTLPWFTAYLMPDLLAAAVVIYAALLIRRFDDLTLAQRLATGGIAAFAIAAHYGHGPLAAGLFAAVLAWRLLSGRLTRGAVLAALLPLLFSPLANIGASSVALDQPSVAPLRLPVLLARSLTDGPARWYLQEACPEAPLAFCEAFEGREVPDNIAAFLWDETGIRSLTPAQLERIREEEYLILRRAFRAYPVAQTRSLLGNAALQTVRIGTGQIYAARRGPDGLLVAETEGRGSAVIATFDRIVPVATGFGAAALLLLALGGRLNREQAEILGVTVLGLLLNAAIFGGLSAPVDRYESRMAWLLPALAVIFLAEMRGRRLATARPVAAGPRAAGA